MVRWPKPNDINYSHCSSIVAQNFQTFAQLNNMSRFPAMLNATSNLNLEMALSMVPCRWPKIY